MTGRRAIGHRPLSATVSGDPFDKKKDFLKALGFLSLNLPFVFLEKDLRAVDLRFELRRKTKIKTSFTVPFNSIFRYVLLLDENFFGHPKPHLNKTPKTPFYFFGFLCLSSY